MSLLLESRATTGLRAPKVVPTNVWPQRGGLAVHWAGDHQGIEVGTPHTTCRARLRSWQDFHMDMRGWGDIAYNWVICQHAVVMVCRGWGVRSAANGTDDSNDRFLAACWMGGTGDSGPTGAVLDQFEQLVQEVRRRGAGLDVEPHQHFYSTDCPGHTLIGLANLWRLMAVTPGANSPTAPAFPLPTDWYFGPASGPTESVSGYYSHRADLAVWQVKVGGLAGDGLYGPLTAAKARAVQSSHGLAKDSLIGRLTWAAAWK
jgi:hypothetical protein